MNAQIQAGSFLRKQFRYSFLWYNYVDPIGAKNKSRRIKIYLCESNLPQFLIKYVVYAVQFVISSLNVDYNNDMLLFSGKNA